MNFHIARWRLWWGYTVLALLLIAGMWFNDSARDLQARVFFVLAAVVFVALELAIRTQIVSLEKAGVVICKGYPRKKVVVDYQDIAGVEVQQSFFQKLCGYGTLVLKKKSESVQVHHVEHVSKLAKVLRK